MKMRLIVVVAFLAAVTTGVADADWDYYGAAPQKFNPVLGTEEYEKSSYVIAVGITDKLEPVQVSDIEKALVDGKEIRLRFAEIQGDLVFTGEAKPEIKQDVYFLYTTFSGIADFGAATFSGMAEFSRATFSGMAGFHGAEFSDWAYFGGATFSGTSIFYAAKFPGTADFHGATFSDMANFGWAKFLFWADFGGAMFSGEADFGGATFSGIAGFGGAMLLGMANFRRAEFGKEVFFNFKLLEGHIVYDEVFFRNLIKHYQDTGWPKLGDDAYYLYRHERRKRVNPFYGLAELMFLEETFGYGVKPWILLRSFLCLWIPFSLYYLGFLRCPGDWFSHGIKPWNPFRDKCRCFLWALIHSLNILTPGIDLQSTRFMETSKYALVKAKSRRVVWVQRIQQLLGWYLLALFLVMFGKIWVR